MSEVASELARLLAQIPKTDRGFSWELRDSRGSEALRCYNEVAKAFKYILDHTDEVAEALKSAERVKPSISPSDIQLLMALQRDNTATGARPVIDRSGDASRQAIRLSGDGLIALEQTMRGMRLHITRAGNRAIDDFLDAASPNVASGASHAD